MYNNVITLIKEQVDVDQYGDIRTTRTERDVFVELKSITQNEFYQAQTLGIKAEIKFVLADFLEYEGERILKYTPFGGIEDVYTVIRTYRINNALELVCKKGIE